MNAVARTTASTLLVSLLVAASACAGAGAGTMFRSAGVAVPKTVALSKTRAVTFTRDVAPILYKNCTTCHRPGGIGPMSLFEYANAVRKADEMRDAVSGGEMPPWHADAPHGTFSNDRRLSEKDKRTIIEWIDAGAPEGDRNDLPPRPEYPSGYLIGTPDAEFAIPEEFHVPARGTIQYQYFEVPTNFTEDKWVQAIEVKPGAMAVVHHALVFARVPNAPDAPSAAPAVANARKVTPQPVLIRREDQRIPDDTLPDGSKAPVRELGSLIGTTAPGTNVLTFAPGTALRIPKGSVLTFQMHYTARGHEMTDRTKVGMVFAKEAPSEEIRATSFSNGQFTIPPGAKDVPVPSEVGFRESVRLYALFPHTHVRGVRWQYTLVQPDGSKTVILNVPKYDFNWQTYYQFATPLEIPGGAKLEATAWYDNSPRDVNPDPTKAVRWGDQTWEEMQYTGFLYSVNSRRLNVTKPK
jgi:hypothetical protein